jgi:hypothetical protein
LWAVAEAGSAPPPSIATWFASGPEALAGTVTWTFSSSASSG